MEPLLGLELISQEVGRRPDEVQGGGGNTSAKLDEKLMAVKASGFKIKQVDRDKGYVKVDYGKIMDFYDHIDRFKGRDLDAENVRIMLENVVRERDEPALRPSIETGMHAALDRYVIHTHSVYANILGCAEGGGEIAARVFAGGNPPVWLPYLNPGFCLAKAVRDAAVAYQEQHHCRPAVFFLENHGLIVTGDNPGTCLVKYWETTGRIREHLRLGAYPEIELKPRDERTYASGNRFLLDLLAGGGIEPGCLAQILIPDQAVYLGFDYSFDGSPARVEFRGESGEIIYHAGRSEAETLDQILTALFYVRNAMSRNGLEVRGMSEEQIRGIIGTEFESYRTKIMKDMK